MRARRFVRFTAAIQAFLLLASLFIPALAAAGSSPTIASDQADYAPGAIVTLTGTGWDPAEAVHIFVNDNDGQTWTYSADVVADDQGGFTTSFTLPSWFVATYTAVATGSSSGTGTTTFTDASLKVAAAPAGATYSLTWTGYSLAGCTGTATVHGPVTIDSTGTTISPLAGVTSVKLAAALLSDQGGAFSSWSGGTAVTTGVVCVAAPTGGRNVTYTATYAVPPTHNTTTAVSCSPNPVTEGNNSTCTATVTDAVDGTVKPHGTIVFATDAVGTFPSGNTCTLSTSGPDAGTCAKGYHPSVGSAGTHHITATYTPDNSGYVTWNASDNNASPFNLTVNGATSPSTTTVSCPVSVPYTGSAQSPCTDTVTGAGGLNTTAPIVYSGDCTNVTVAGCTATATYAGDTNHAGNSGSSSFLLTQADATCSVTGYHVTYDSFAHTATGSCTGVGGVLDVLAGLVLTGTTHTNAADYPADAWTFTDVTGNYNNTGGTVHDAITPAALDIYAVFDTKVYDGGTSSAGTPSVSGLQGTDNVTGLSQSFASKNVLGANGSTLNVNGGYTVNDGNGGANYSPVTLHNHAGTITPRPITITANDQTKTLGATFTFAGTEFLITSGALVSGESISSVTLTSAGAAPGAAIGSYPIVPSAAVFGVGSAGNYAITYASGTLKVLFSYGCSLSAGGQVLQPVNLDGSSVFKKGSTVPVKFRVCDVFGNSIGGSTLVVAVDGSGHRAPVIYATAHGVGTIDESVYSTTPDTDFRWDPTNQQWIFNLNTSNLVAGVHYYYSITLTSGQVIYFDFGVK
ncbi:MAG TPA: PxKF domain-containing protein [Candidatus Limnocylindrales bacterium]